MIPRVNGHDFSIDSIATPLERLRLIRHVLADEAQTLASLSRQIGPEAVEAAQRIADCRGSVVIVAPGRVITRW